MKLNTTAADLDAMTHIVNEAREGTKTVKVDKHALFTLIRDHREMAGELRRVGIYVED